MSFKDLKKRLQNALVNWGYRQLHGDFGHTGKWGTKDFGVTEFIQDVFKPKKAYAQSGGSNFFGPTTVPQNQQVNASTLTQVQTDRGPGLGMSVAPKYDLTKNVTTNTGGLGGGGNGGSGGSGNGGDTGGGLPGLDQLIAAAQARYQALMDSANQAYKAAEDYYNSGLALLEKKANEFQDLFKQGKGDILTEASRVMGGIGRDAEALRQRERNSARALGLGGSFLQSRQQALADALARSLASARQTQQKNMNKNLELLNQRMSWKTDQENQLRNYLEQAKAKLMQAQGVNAADFATNIGNLENMMSAYIGDIAGAGNRLSALQKGFGSYGKSKYTPSFENLVNALNKMAGVRIKADNQQENANPVSLNPYLQELLRRMGAAYSA